MTSTDSRLSAALSQSIQNAIHLGLEFLRRSQLPSGEYVCLRSTHPMMEEDCVGDSSPFATSLICLSIRHAASPTVEEMMRKASVFFLSQMEPGGVWRYWTKQHPYYKTIPPDLDDISCVSLALQASGIDPPCNRNLLLANRSPSGLFYTWIIPRWRHLWNPSSWKVVPRTIRYPLFLYYFFKLNESAPQDIDAVVNANTLLYLGSCRATEPVVSYLIKILQEHREESCDKWHLNKFMVYYAISRCIPRGILALEAISEVIVARILATAGLAGMLGNGVLDTALATCALLHCGYPAHELTQTAQYLISRQMPQGAWAKEALYHGGPKRYYGWGSEELTTGFCIEVLAQISKALQLDNTGS